MITLSVSTDLERFNRVLKEIGEKAAHTVYKRSINRTLEGLRTDIVTEVCDKYAVKAGSVRDTIRIDRATETKLEGTLTSRGKGIPLSEFNPIPSVPTKTRPAGGITVEVEKSSRHQYPHAFMVAGSRYKGVFERKRDKRYPIIKKYGPSVPEMIENHIVLYKIIRLAEERYLKAIEHEINFYFTQGKK